MFDIDWSDPGLEKVGEREARKKKEQQAKSTQSNSQRGSRPQSSLTTSTSRSSSSADRLTLSSSSRTGNDSIKSSSLFGFALTKKKRHSVKSKTTAPLDLQIPIPKGTSIPPSLPTDSTFGSTFSSTDFTLGNTSSNSTAGTNGKPTLEPIDTLLGTQSCPLSSSSVSTHSGPAQATPSQPQSPRGNLLSEPNFSGRTEAVRVSSPCSRTTMPTETGVEGMPKTPRKRVGSETTIAAGRDSSEQHGPKALSEKETKTSTNATAAQMKNISMSPLRRRVEPILPRPRVTVKTQTSRGAPKKIKFTAHDPRRWKTPEEWGLVPESDAGTEPSLDALDGEFQVDDRDDSDTFVTSRDSSEMVNLSSVLTEVRGMASHGPKEILSRLEENMDLRSDILDPAAYKESEMAKKRLMLFALFRSWDEPGGKIYTGISSEKGEKVLALFEPEATATYISAMHPELQVTHLAPSPLSTLLYPNTRPIYSPVAPKSVLILTPEWFTTAYCLFLPSLMPSQEIPEFLRNVYACLKVGGVLHLVLFDPAPVASSLGPHMRRWMEDNLILNLERQFRCTKPRKLVPIWLQDSYLRADKTTIKTVRCPVIFSDHGGKEVGAERTSSEIHDRPASSDGSSSYIMAEAPSMAEDEEGKLELQVKIAGMLWQETWGAFVNADQWWWEDPGCVEECKRLGTYWEYSVVEATKSF